MKHYIIVDTETGGLDPEKNPVLELTATIFDEAGAKVDTFHAFFEPYKSMDCKALSINGYLNRRPELPKGNNQAEVEKFVMWSAAVAKKYNPTMVGHNLKFDIGFIDSLVEHHGMQGWSKIFNFMMLDTMMMAFLLKDVGILKTDKFNLTALSQAMGIKNEAAHTSGGDVDATAGIFFAMLEMLKAK